MWKLVHFEWHMSRNIFPFRFQIIIINLQPPQDFHQPSCGLSIRQRLIWANAMLNSRQGNVNIFSPAPISITRNSSFRISVCMCVWYRNVCSYTQGGCTRHLGYILRFHLRQSKLHFISDQYTESELKLRLTENKNWSRMKLWLQKKKLFHILLIR